MKQSKHSLDFLPGNEDLFENAKKSSPKKSKDNQSGTQQKSSKNQKNNNKKNYSRNKHKTSNNQSNHKNNHHKKSSPKKNNNKKGQPKLKIIPLGGNEEVGRNMTVFEYGDDILILDMGIQFPEEDTPGVDFIIPNIDYLKDKKKNIRAVLLSHGHLDHIGAAPILLEQLGYPTVVARKMTLEMTKEKMEDRQKGSTKSLKSILIKGVDDKFTFGNFKVKFFQIEHSVMDAVGIILETPSGTVIHPGDWTLEKDHNRKPILDYSHLSKLPRPTFLMMESLGAIDVRKSATEDEMEKNLRDLIAKAPGRMIIGTFSSQIERIGFVIKTAEKLGKKVAIDGYSMKKNIEIAKNLGYIKMNKKTMIGVHEIDKYKDKEVVVLCTGAQGERRAVLSRIINNEHRHINLKKQDTVILSSSIIPGNERSIQQLKDNLYRQCDNVIHGELMDIHVSGHGNRQDIIYMLKSIQPDYFIPVYAYHYMLKEAAGLAEQIGIKKDQIFVADNGQIIEVPPKGKGKAKLTDKRVPSDYVLIDGTGSKSLNDIVLKDRMIMGNDGMLVLIATIDKKSGKLKTNPDIISRGFIYMKENKKLVEQIRDKVEKITAGQNVKSKDKINKLRETMRDKVGQFVYSKIGRRPMILPVIITI